MTNSELIKAAQEVINQWRQHAECKVPAWAMLKLIEAVDAVAEGQQSNDAKEPE